MLLIDYGQLFPQFGGRVKSENLINYAIHFVGGVVFPLPLVPPAAAKAPKLQAA